MIGGIVSSFYILAEPRTFYMSLKLIFEIITYLFLKSIFFSNKCLLRNSRITRRTPNYQNGINKILNKIFNHNKYAFYKIKCKYLIRRCLVPLWIWKNLGLLRFRLNKKIYVENYALELTVNSIFLFFVFQFRSDVVTIKQASCYFFG